MNVNVKPKNLREIEALLEFYAASGVDCAVDEMAHNHFSTMRATPHEGRASVSPPSDIRASHLAFAAPSNNTATPDRVLPNPSPPPNPILPDGDMQNAARDQAASAQTLDELAATLAAFNGCNLKRTAKNLVFGDGNPKARLMLVGEAPGRDEDIAGIPFVGRSGELLNKMLAAIGLDRARDVYIANLIPWRPPGNRTPTPQEIELCRPFIERQIELVNPDLLVPLGAPAARQLLGTSDGIKKLRGRTKTYQLPERPIELIATLHPAYLLRQPSEKRLAWQDFLMIKKRLGALALKAGTDK